ncbi:Cobalt-zinc-cadmium resistance protein [hydrothermal vent metagenome]|uniref:Cobalt-zinc-cadmium resistance protein n=1 Tax=hydrothermal vent metagenome TaxID=652676 RepID=A0A3B0YYK1_9ZZZZ
MSNSHSHPPLDPHDHRYLETRKVTLIGAFIDAVLGFGKILIGTISTSTALVADGIHSLSDLATDFIVLFAAKHSSRGADEAHPYGHARIETATTVALGSTLIIVALGIGWHAIERLFSKDYQIPGELALMAALISVVAKESIYHYTMHVAKQIKSKMLEANAWHSRSDAISSVIVVVGILGTMAGIEYLDAIAAVGVAYIIAKIGWRLSWQSVQELVDTGLDQEATDKIRQIISSISGVVDLHYLRTRTMGSDALVDVHIQVGRNLSVSEGHQISENVRWQLIQEMEDISDVLVHIDPEDDAEESEDCCHLPLRNVVMAELEKQWHTIPAYKKIKRITLHYLDNAIQIEVLLPLSEYEGIADVQQLRDSFSLPKNVVHINDIQLYFI